MGRTKGFNQEEVLDKAMNLFWKQGFHATSMQDLVETLGINRASLYETFGSKQHLFDLAIKRYCQLNNQKIADFLYYQTNVRQGLLQLFELLIDKALTEKDSKGCFVVNTTTELATMDLGVNKMMQEQKAAVEQIYFNYLQYGVNQGQISQYKNLQNIATFLYSLQTGIYVISKIQSNKEAFLKVVATGLAILD